MVLVLMSLVPLVVPGVRRVLVIQEHLGHRSLALLDPGTRVLPYLLFRQWTRHQIVLVIQIKISGRVSCKVALYIQVMSFWPPSAH